MAPIVACGQYFALLKVPRKIEFSCMNEQPWYMSEFHLATERVCKYHFNFRVRSPRECVEENVEAQVRSINMLTFFFQEHSSHGDDDT